MKGVLVKTDRFLLRSLTKNDVAERYIGWLQDPSNQYINYTQEAHSVEDIRSYVEYRDSSNSILFLGIFSIENKEHIGNIKYEPIDFKKYQATMGILIGERDWQGKGVASEVIMASAIWLKAHFKIKRIFLGVDLNNKPAIKAYIKIGFKTISCCSKNQIMALDL